MIQKDDKAGLAQTLRTGVATITEPSPLKSDKVGLAQTLREMYASGWGGRSTYNRLYRAVMDGDVAAENAPGTKNRLQVRRSDFPQIAAVLGLTPPAVLGSQQHVAAAEHTNT